MCQHHLDGKYVVILLPAAAASHLYATTFTAPLLLSAGLTGTALTPVALATTTRRVACTAVALVNQLSAATCGAPLVGVLLLRTCPIGKLLTTLQFSAMIQMMDRWRLQESNTRGMFRVTKFRDARSCDLACFKPTHRDVCKYRCTVNQA